MFLLILGLVLFLGSHAFTMARAPRAALIGRLGENGFKGLYSLLALAGFVLIIYGFGSIARADGSTSGSRRSGRGICRFC